jgi:AcrR family transcriptional regulator
MQNVIPTENDTKTRIFQVAARLMAQKGFNGVSMREISEQSGVSKPMIYYYFESKEKLYQSLVEVGLAHDANLLETIRQADIPIKQKLVELIKIYFKQSVQHPEFVKFFLYLFVAIEDTPLGTRFRNEELSRKKNLVKLVQQGIERGEFGTNIKPEIAVEMIIGTITHFMWHQLNSKRRIVSDQLAAEIVEVLFKGLND